MEGSYELLETPPDELVDRIKFLKSNGYTGFNVTIPLKVPTTLFIDKVDDAASVAGCVNTVKIMPDKSLFGFNTDIYGFKRAIDKDSYANLKNKKAVVLGTGGAARACGIGLAQIGLSEIDFYARNVINSTDMINFLRGQFPTIKINLKQFQSLGNLSDVAIVVNTTPLGMKNKAMDESPISEDAIKTLAVGAIVYDIIYNPIETELVKMAKKHNIRTINGLDMFIYQAQKAFELWTGKTPSYELMKIAALEHMLINK